jgi:hypothetical protein
MIREYWMETKITARYEIHHAYQRDGFENIIDVQELVVDGMKIKIREEPTGRKAPLTPWDQDEKVPPGDIVNIHLLLNDQEISNPDEIWLSNRNRGSRYFSWLDVLTVKDRVTGEKQISIVQRLTDDDHPMEGRKWKIITISQDSNVKEEELHYAQRRDHPLGVNLVNFSGTVLMSMGYYSDILQVYPSLFFPFLYPVLTFLVGLILLMIVLRLFYKRYRSSKVDDLNKY